MPEINDIIKNRQANATSAIKKKKDLEELERKIKELQRLRPEILKAPGITSVVSDRLKKVDLQGILDIVTQERELWERIEKRLNRDTINIAVVGLARQGKSTFLQQITLLTDAEIPTDDGPPCTTTQSNIYHSEQSSGRVYFHSESSFMEQVIVPYFQKLGFVDVPKNIEDFGQSRLPNLPKNSTDASIYKHLKNEYHDHFKDYRGLLKKEKYETEISKDKIKEYVSQKYDAATSQPTFFNHLAVEKVEIFCPFPNRGVQKIGLIDMPGLGDTRLGDAERMIKAIAEDTDFILFIRRPAEGGMGAFWGPNDTQLYDLAYKALEDKLPLEEWSFMLLNYDGTNQRQCKDLNNNIESNRILVKKCLQSNCKDSTSAKGVLTEILTYLETNLVRLDKQYMSLTHQQSSQRQQQVKLELQGLEQAIANYGDINAQYVLLRDEFNLELLNNIEEFRKEKRQEFDTPNSEFEAEVDAAINRCQQEFNIPDSKVFNTWVSKWAISGAYFRAKQQMRARILKNFHLMETGLKAAIDDTKLDLANILIQLGVGNVVKDSELEFFPAMLEIFSKSSNFPNLRFAFEFITSFEVTYKGIIQYRVWEEIAKVISPNTEISTEAPDNMNLVANDLKKLHQKAIEVCQEILEDLGVSFNNGRISMVEEFADYIIQAEGVEAEWDIFLSNNRSKVWPQLREMEEQEQLRKQWLYLVQETLAINEKIKLSF